MLKDKVKNILYEQYNGEKPGRSKKPNIKPSSLGSECYRKIFYDYLKVEPDEDFDIEKIQMFQKGEFYHDMVKSWYKKAGFLINPVDENGEKPTNYFTGEPEDEFPVSDFNLNLKMAKIDGVTVVPEGSETLTPGVWLLEIKSVNNKGFKYIQKKPKPEHKIQGNLYCYLFERDLADGKLDHIESLKGYREVQGCLFAYLNREDDRADWIEHVVDKDLQLFRETVKKIKKIHNYEKKKKLPPPTPEFCDWCKFRFKCDKDYNPLD